MTASKRPIIALQIPVRATPQHIGQARQETALAQQVMSESAIPANRKKLVIVMKSTTKPRIRAYATMINTSSGLPGHAPANMAMSRLATSVNSQRSAMPSKKPITASPIRVRATPQRIGLAQQEAVNVPSGSIRMAIPANPMMHSIAEA